MITGDNGRVSTSCSTDTSNPSCFWAHSPAIQRVVALLAEKRQAVLLELSTKKAQVRADEALSIEEKAARLEVLLTVEGTLNGTYIQWKAHTNNLRSVLEQDFNNYDSILKFYKLDHNDRRHRIMELQIEAMREENMVRKMGENEKIIDLFDDARKRYESVPIAAGVIAVAYGYPMMHFLPSPAG